MKKLLLLLALFSTVIAYAEKKPKEKKKPNVLFITVDDLNTHIPLFGYNDVMTPNIDKLAGEGVLFKQAFCQYPVCGPSRASFLTGMYPDQTKIFTNGPHVIDTRPDAVSIGKVFKDNDYWVVYIPIFNILKRSTYVSICQKLFYLLFRQTKFISMSNSPVKSLIE